MPQMQDIIEPEIFRGTGREVAGYVSRDLGGFSVKGRL